MPVSNSIASTSIAIIVIDMLRDYFDPQIWPGSALLGRDSELASNINVFTRVAREKSMPVFWVRQEFAPDLSDAFPHMQRSSRRYTIKGTDGCKLLADLEVAPADFDVVKKRFSAFFETDLHERLGSLGVTTIILAGITSSWCVRSTAVDAYQLGYTVLLAAGTMAGFNEDDHDNSLSEMDGYIAEIVSVGDLQ